MVATDVAVFSVRPSVQLLHNIPVLYSFIYFLETCVICLSCAVTETVKTYYKNCRVKVIHRGQIHMSIFYVYPISFSLMAEVYTMY